MKEAFWGLLIVLLGLFGVVVVNLFQNVTVDNDRVYYLIKESTEAAAYDAIDLTYYRVTGNIRIVEDKFVENLARRFAQNVTIGDYKIIVEDLNELPPKISLRIRSGVTSLQGEEFGLLNRVDGIIEVKYNKDELEDFLCEGKTEEECTEIMNKFNTKVEINESNGENQCKVDITNDEMDCIPGDIKFMGWDNHDLPTGICSDEEAPRNKERTAKYKTCDCGKWGEEKTERVTANPTKVGNEYVYTWTFKKETDVKVVDESVKGRVRIEVCTTSIGIKVPDNYKKLKPGVTSSNTYIDCPTGGVRIPEGTIMKVQGSYVPQNAVNREIIWTKSNNNIALKYDGTSYARLNPNMNTCELNKTNTNCMSKNEVTARDVEPKEVVSSNIIATNYRRKNQTATCKVTIWDGVPDTLGCKDKKIKYNETATMEITYTPENASKLDVKWVLDDSTYATINEDTGSVTGRNNASPLDKTITVTVTSKEDSTKTGTCTLTVQGKPCPSGSKATEAEAKKSKSCEDYQNKTVTFDESNGCYTAKCTCKYATEAAAKAAKSCGSGQTKQAHKGSGGCYYATCVASSITVGGGDSSCGSYTIEKEHVGSHITTGIDAEGKEISVSVPTYARVTYRNGEKYHGPCTSSGRRNVYCKFKRTKNIDNPNLIATRYIGTESCTYTPSPVKPQPPANCFLAGTKVLTNEGLKNIEDIEVGDVVLSYNTDKQTNEYNTVKKIFEYYNDGSEELYELTINNKVIKVTASHSFYVNNSKSLNVDLYIPNSENQITSYKLYSFYKPNVSKINDSFSWISAKNLKIGYMVMDSNGNYYPITNIIHYTYPAMVYNISVENNVNYYVTDSAILVHNAIHKRM